MEEFVAGEEYAFILDGPTLDATLVAEVVFVGTVDSDDLEDDREAVRGLGGEHPDPNRIYLTFHPGDCGDPPLYVLLQDGWFTFVDGFDKTGNLPDDLLGDAPEGWGERQGHHSLRRLVVPLGDWRADPRLAERDAGA